MSLGKPLGNFINRLENLNHISPLLPTGELVIKFEFEGRYMFLTVSSKGCSVLDDYSEPFGVTISGNEGVLELINGTKPLGKLVSENSIEIKATYRNTLLIESLFYLCRTRKNEKIIS